jgi:hypothetical protein
MSRLFITQRELNFIADITKECVKDVIGQRIFYYPISETKTRTHELYNEGVEKVYDHPIEIEALVDMPANETSTNLFGPERLNKLDVFVQHRDMVDRGINVSIGDFLRYGETIYEIAKVIFMRNIYGQVEQIDGVKLVCTQARQGQFTAPQVGPTDIAFSDKDAVQREFVQKRGLDKVDDKPTGDVRKLQENGVLDKPISGPARVNNVDGDIAGDGFYDDT